MVKKTQRVNAASLGYVFNDDYLDDILGSVGQEEQQQCGSNNLKKAAQSEKKLGKKQGKKGGQNEENEESESDETFYEVEKILEKKKEGRKSLYLVKWQGYPESQATWEPLANLSNVKDIVKEYEKNLELMASGNQPSTCISHNLNVNNQQQSILSNGQNQIITQEENQALNEICQKSKPIKKTKTQKQEGNVPLIKKTYLGNKVKSLGKKVILAPVQQQQQPPLNEYDEKLQSIQMQKQLLEQQQQQIREQEERILQEQLQKQQQLQQQQIQQQQEEEQDQLANPQKQSVKQFFGQRRNKLAQSIQNLESQHDNQLGAENSINPNHVSLNDESYGGGGQTNKRGGGQARKRGPKKQHPIVQQPEPEQINSIQATEMIQEQLPVNGSFEHDIPEKVVGAKMSGGIIQVTIDWQIRQNGIKPLQTTYTNEEVKNQCPKLLVDFYESRINARSRPSEVAQQTR